MREDRFWKFIKLAYLDGLNNSSEKFMIESVKSRLRNIDTFDNK